MIERKLQPTSSHWVTGVVVEPDGVRVFAPLAEVDACTLAGCAAEDPADWNDCALVWPRYRFDSESAEFADGLPSRPVELADALSMLAEADSWLALELVGKRVLSGGDFRPLSLGNALADQDRPAQRIILPPWWELHQHVDPGQLSSARATPIRVPNPRRDVLWGSAMTRFCAEAMIRAVREGRPWIGKDWEGKPCGKHELTVEVHRDWLMTPRDDLRGGIPRDCLHGGKDWIDSLASAQTFRVNERTDAIPIPKELSTYQSAPMGRNEMIMYFDACRETIGAGWSWLIEDQRRIEDPNAAEKLAQVMDEWLATWLTQPFEEGPPPAEIIRCDRARIPLVDRGGNHMVDCDCPICQMMAEGQFGPSFICFDGHHLELDDQFAFSMCETREEWEREQQVWEAMDASIRAPEESVEKVERRSDGNEGLEPVWNKTWQSDDAIPGDKHGHLGLAFRVADMVSSLKDAGAPQQDVDELNAAFRAYRTAAVPGEVHRAATFKHALETLACKHRYLVSRSADLQSQIDELARALATDPFDRDIPF